MKLTIIFFGLIIHVNQPWSLDNTAVLPDAEHHKAEMHIPKAALVDDQAPWIKDKCATDPCIISLKDINVRITGTDGWFSSMSDDLIKSLPPLRTLAPRCGGLRHEVRDRIPLDKQLASFIDYRGGKRDLEKHFLAQAGFPDSSWEQPRCIACKVRYEANLDEETATFVFTLKKENAEYKVKIRGGYTILVNHLPDPDTPVHFGLHYRIYDPKEQCTGPNPLIYDELECAEPNCKGTDYTPPQPFPQADCTNSGYP